MKIEIEELQSILIKNDVPKDLIPAVIKDARKVVEELKEEREETKGVKSKYKHLIVVSDPDGKHPDIENIPMWIVKVTEGTDHTTVLEKLYKAARDFNATKKGAKNPVRKVAEIFEVVKAKFFKPDRNPIVTKEPVTVLVSNGEIPR